MTDLLDVLYAPANYGDWLGVTAPRYDSGWDTYREQVEHHRNLGLRWSRHNFSFNACCRQDQLEGMCEAVAYAVSIGSCVIANFSTTGIDDHQLDNGMPDDFALNQYEALMYPVVVALWEAGVRVYESHNEWNGPGVKGQVDVPRVAKVLGATYAMVHAVATMRDERCMVLPGGTGATEDETYYSPAAYEQLCTEPMGLSFDASTHHAGAHPYDPHVPEDRYEPWNGFYQTQWVNDVCTTSRPATRTWVTEMPYPTNGNGAFADEATAAERCARDLITMHEWAEQGITGPQLIYHGLPDGAKGQDNSAGFGIRRADGADKQTCDVLRNAATQPLAL